MFDRWAVVCPVLHVRLRSEVPQADTPVEYSTGCTLVTAVGEVAEGSRRCETTVYLKVQFELTLQRDK